MIPIPLSLTAAIAAICLLLGAWAGHQATHNAWEADQAKQLAQAAQIAAQQRTDSSKVEAQYVHDIQTVTVPVEVVRDRIVHAACPGVRDTAGGAVPVPDSDSGQSADAAFATDPSLAEISDDIPAAVLNTDQLDSLQALIRANTAHP